MRDSLRPGTALTKSIEIDRDRTIGFMGIERLKAKAAKLKALRA